MQVLVCAGVGVYMCLCVHVSVYVDVGVYKCWCVQVSMCAGVGVCTLLYAGVSSVSDSWCACFYVQMSAVYQHVHFYDLCVSLHVCA